MKFFPSVIPLLVAVALPTSAQVVNYQPVVLVSSGGMLEVTLDVGLLESLNETRVAPAYNGATVGPTIRVRPGDNLKVILKNSLEPGSALDRELNEYIMNEQNSIDSDANVTTIYNRLNTNGNIYDPTYGFWGQRFQNIHFHGASFPPSIENVRAAIDGGESKEYVFQIAEDMDPGLFWYHNHVHGTAAYSYLSSLFGFMVVEGTDNDITKVTGIDGATEIFVVLSEGLVNEDKSIPPFFSIAFQFDWKSLANGVLGEQTEYEVTQGEKILFRAVSATVEPTIHLSIPDTSFVIVAYDGLPLPKPEEVEVVTLSGGSRVEFLARFDTPGTYVMTRAGWNAGIDSAEKCLGAFGAKTYPCISYDVEQVAFTIKVLAVDSFEAATTSLISEVELPAYSERLMALAAMKPVDEKIVSFEQAVTYPIFQVPFDGVFAPPGVGFGMNDRLMTPWHHAGNVTANSCETWTVTSFPPAVEHPFHAHAAKFMVTHIDGEAVDEPFWRDTFPVNGFNFTAHICFDDVLEPGDSVVAHCHMPSHLDIGLGSFYRVVAAPEAEEPTAAPSSAISPAVFLSSAITVLISLMLW